MQTAYVDFFRAVNVDNAGKVTELLARGFDPNTVNDIGPGGAVPGHARGRPKVAAVLLASPALKVDAANAAGETPLMMAALKGRLDWAKKLFDRGAQVHKPGWTPVHYAASGPSTELLALLLDRGADIDALAPNGTTPLMMAARFGTEDSVKLLVQRGADKKLLQRSQPFGRRHGSKRSNGPGCFAGWNEPRLGCLPQQACQCNFRQAAWPWADWYST